MTLDVDVIVDRDDGIATVRAMHGLGSSLRLETATQAWGHVKGAEDLLQATRTHVAGELST